jgi:hypothetical protein
MNVRYSDDAEDDWRRLKLEDAVAVARAVQSWAATGAGVVYAAGAGEFRLFVGELPVVVFLIEDTTDTMHVIQVRRA